MNLDPGRPDRLERRVRPLLLAYPAEYRAERGEEILGTLLEATSDGARWLRAREVVSVLAGGVRARAVANQRTRPAEALGQMAILGSGCYLAFVASGDLMDLSAGWFWQGAVAGVALMAAIVAAWSGRWWLATAAAVTAAAALILEAFANSAGDLTAQLPWLAAPLLALAVVGFLVRRAERPRGSWLLLPCVPLAAALTGPLLTLLGASYAGQVSLTVLNSQSEVHALVVLFAVLWLSTDVRPLGGIAIAFLFGQFGPIVSAAAGQGPVTGDVVGSLQGVQSSITWAAGSLVLVLTLSWWLRRRARRTLQAS